MVPKSKAEAPVAPEDPLVALRRRVVAMRGDLREVSARFQLKWEAELHAIQENLGRVASFKEAERREAWVSYAARMLELVESTRIRPKRGRLKDLSRLKLLTQTMHEESPK